MDKLRQRIEELHQRRREIMAQEMKAYLAPPEGEGLWATIGAQPREMPKVIHRLATKILTLPPNRDNRT